MKKYFFDIILGLFVIVISITIYLSLFIKKDDNDLYAVLYYQNEEYDRVNISILSEELIKEYDFDGKKVIVEYTHNKVQVKSAECHDHTCEKMGPSSSTNKPIVCLDIGYIIKIESSDSLDVVVG